MKSVSLTASWDKGQSAVIETVAKLDELLDRIDREARDSGLPQNVQLTDGGAAGTLGLVVGTGRSMLNHTPADGRPPYLASIGEEQDDRPFTFYVAGDHHSESHWRHTIPIATAREAARVFLNDARLDTRVRWDEI